MSARRENTRAQSRIEKVYFSSKPGGLSRKQTFLKAHPELPRGEVDRFFKTHPVLRQFYGAPKSDPKRAEHHCVARAPLERLHMDLMYLKDPNYPYALLAVCNYTRYAYAVPLVNKSSEETARGLAVVLSRVKGDKLIKTSATTLLCDKGKEFLGSAIRQVLQDNNAFLHQLTTGRSKAAMAERLIRTLRGRLALLQTRSPKPDSVYLSRVLQGYNRTAHSSLPKDTSPEVALRKNLHLEPRPSPGDNIVQELLDRREASTRDGVLNKGDVVRLKLVKQHTFTKGSEMRKIGLELFVVTLVKTQRESPLPYYQLQDLQGEPIQGLFRRDELVPVNRDEAWHPLHPRFRPTLRTLVKTEQRGRSTVYHVTLQGARLESEPTHRPVILL